jgi:tetratricopeptide (TPR) repeat protein
MRVKIYPLIACTALFFLTFGTGAETRAQSAESPAIAAPFQTRAQQLDSAFETLGKTRDPEQAAAVADRIWEIWRDSGSETVNLLMQWADDAVAEKKYPAALDFLDQVITLLPDYAEGWNKRATLHFNMNAYRKSMADINEVLKREPRHFGALAGMAMILEQAGHDADALAAWEKMLDIYPANRDAQKKVTELTEKLAGGRI